MWLNLITGPSLASRRQWAFIQDCLHELRDHTTRCGQPLCIRTGSVTDVLSKLAERYEILAIHAHQETGNSWTYARDRQVADWCRFRHIPYVTIRLMV